MIDPRDPDFTNTPASPRRPAFGYAPADGGDHPFVTIVTATCRADEKFHETAHCVLHQSFQQWEWVIVNDAPQDPDLRELLRQVAARDARICVLEHERNLGPGAARNTGVRAARSEYVYFVDDDDLIEPTTLEKSVWYLETHPEHDFTSGWSVGFGDQHYLWNKGFDRRAEFLTDNLATGRAMIRRRTFEAVGGFDEALVDGFEDWDLWLRCADRGFWGGTVPEYFDWYRRREDHSDRWSDWDAGRRKDRFRTRLREAYPKLYREGFPTIEPTPVRPFEPVDTHSPCANRLAVGNPRILLILPWLTMGGSDKFNLDVVARLCARGFEVSIATTLTGSSSWESEFARYTPDIFHLHHIVPLAHQPRFLGYLIDSRQPEVVLVSHSELAYLVSPYLRARCPEPVYLDYCHMEQEDWKGGGYPRLSAGTQAHFDLNIVSSQHLKRWMSDHGADPGRIEVLYTSIDTETWSRQTEARKRLRDAWGALEEDAVILFSGRICSQKQPMVLAATLLELVRRGHRFKGVIAGDGEDRPQLESFLRRNRLDRCVEIVGPVSNREIRDLLSASDILFLPSQWEGIALVLFEAMAMELAVVGADVGGQRELVIPDCGMLLPRADEQAETRAYADALEALLLDPQRRRQLGQRGRERVQEHFRLDQMVERLLVLFDRARGSREQSARPPLDREMAAEWATQAVEYVRISQLADALWTERERFADRNRGASPAPDVDPLGLRLRTEAELDYIESARSWRWVRSLHRSLLGRIATRLRLARDLELIDAIDDPALRLAKIEATLSYRLIRALKSTPVHRAWARRRYGHESHPRQV